MDMPTDNFQMNQPMDSMMGGDMNMPMDNQDMSMGNQPMDMNQEPMGDENNFDFGDNDNQSEMSDDPEKQVESLIGKAASIIRKDLNSDGINKHEDKKKEVLGMLAAAIIDGMDDEERNSIIDYLSDKLTKGDDNKSEDTSIDNGEGNDEEESNDNENIEMMESIVKKMMEDMLIDKNVSDKDKKIVDKVKKPQQGKYSKSPYTK